MKPLLTASLAVVLSQIIFAQGQGLSESQRKEVADLKAKAQKLTKQVGVITSNSNLQDSDEAVKLLKQVVDELSAIRERLKSLEDSRSADSKQTGTLAKDVEALKNTRFTGFIQFQYNTTNKTGS